MGTRNTKISYFLRGVIFSLCFFIGILLTIPSLARHLGLISSFILGGGTLVVLILLSFELEYEKDPSRPYSKLIDTLILAGWLFALAYLFLRSVAMGIL